MKVNAVEATSQSMSWQNTRKAFLSDLFCGQYSEQKSNQGMVFRRFYVMVVSGSSFNKEGVEINFVETWSSDCISSGFCMVLPRAKSLKEKPNDQAISRLHGRIQRNCDLGSW